MPNISHHIFQYTAIYFPSVRAHGSHSRIDYFFLSGLAMHRVLSCSIGSILISDHAKVVLDLYIKGVNREVKFWRLNTSILKDHTFVTHFTTEFQYFISINTQSTDNPALPWETAKAYATGVDYFLFSK